MPAIRGLSGFKAQALGGASVPPAPVPAPLGYAAVYGKGSYTWTCPKSGRYRFAQWGGGMNYSGVRGGASGSHAQTLVRLVAGQQVGLVIGHYGAAPNGNAVVTFPDGRVVTSASPTSISSVAVATGGDINLNGSLGGNGIGVAGASGLGDNPGAGAAGNGSNGGAAGAPGSGSFKGGDGGLSGGTASTPGGGMNDSGGGTSPGHALVIILLESRY